MTALWVGKLSNHTFTFTMSRASAVLSRRDDLPHLPDQLHQECTLLWSAVAMSVSLPASSSLLDSPLKDSRQAQSELNILNMGLLEDTDLYFFIVSMIILSSKFVNSKKMLLRLFADL